MILVNGRLIRKHTMGVSRYTQEIVNRFGNQARILKPRGFAKKGKGIIWEQFALPRIIGSNDLLWSPANTGPIIVKNQVITIHDLIPFDHPEWFNQSFSSYYKYISPRIVKIVHRIITDSHFSKQRIIDLFGVPEGKVIVIPLGVGDEFAPTTKEQIDIVLKKYDVTSPYFFVLGTIEPRKNLARLFHAWQDLLKIFPEYQLIVAGIGIAPSSRTRKFNVPEGVKLIGYVDEEDLPSLYCGAIALIFPSIYEGFGLPMLEAMACGTPVIASNSTSIPEVVGDASLLFNPFDVDDIATSIKKFVHDSDLRSRLRERGLKQARKFSWDYTAKSVWAVLNQTYTEIHS